MRRDLFRGLIGLRVRLGLFARGNGPRKINTLMDGMNDDLIHAASLKAGVKIPEAIWDADDAGATPGEPVGADGEHPIIDAIVKFLNSDFGRALIQALIALLVAA